MPYRLSVKDWHSFSKDLLMTGKTVAYQGIPGSFSYLAATTYFGDNYNWLGTSRFCEIFSLIEKQQADFGIIPVENSLAGSVYENYDLLARHKLTATAELYLKVEHHLLILPQTEPLSQTTKLKQITRVVSHPKALEQCSQFFEEHPWIEQMAFSDTARAAQHVAQTGSDKLAAIASQTSADLYQLEVLQNNLEDNQNNYTRFLIIADKADCQKKANKSSIIFTVSHKPGSLFGALEVLAKNNLNLTKLESRPIPNKPFEYIFYVDFEFETGKLDRLTETLNQFKVHTLEFKVLGHYQAANRVI